MKKEYYISIPEPCHEDWNKMTPVQQGRYCESCCKEVVDFSVMTDQEIINFISKPRGKTCGNFSPDQLDRSIREIPTAKKKRIWAVMLSFLMPLYAVKATAQRGKIKVTPTVQKDTAKCTAALRGDTIANEITTNKINIPRDGNIIQLLEGRVGGLVVTRHSAPQIFTIKGRVTDSYGYPVAGATIMIKGGRIGTTANEKGEYTLSVPGSTSFFITVSAIGFSSEEVAITRNNEGVNTNITLQQHQQNLAGEVVIVGLYKTKRTSPPSVKKLITDTLQVLKPSAVHIFPNPATKGGFVNIQCKTPATYEVQLFNSQHEVFVQSTFMIASKKGSYNLELPATIAAGIYFMQITDAKEKKQYTRKLVIQ